MTVDQILAVVCERYQMNRQHLLGKSRIHKIAHPRMVAMYLMRVYGKMSFPKIGNVLGGRDHSTIVHGVQLTKSKMDSNPIYRADVFSMVEKLGIKLSDGVVDGK